MVQSQTVTWSRRLGLSLALLASLIVAAPVHGQAKVKDEPPGFLLPPELEQWPRWVPMAVGMGAQPSTGVLSALAVLHAGEHPQIQEIRPPFESKNTRIQVGAGMLFLSGFTAAVQPGPQVVSAPRSTR